MWTGVNFTHPMTLGAEGMTWLTGHMSGNYGYLVQWSAGVYSRIGSGNQWKCGEVTASSATMWAVVIFDRLSGVLR